MDVRQAIARREHELAATRSTALNRDHGNPVRREEIVARLREARTLERARALAHVYARRAQDALDLFDPCPAREALRSLPEFVISREY